MLPPDIFTNIAITISFTTTTLLFQHLCKKTNTSFYASTLLLLSSIQFYVSICRKKKHKHFRDFKKIFVAFCVALLEFTIVYCFLNLSVLNSLPVIVMVPSFVIFILYVISTMRPSLYTILAGAIIFVFFSVVVHTEFFEIRWILPEAYDIERFFLPQQLSHIHFLSLSLTVRCLIKVKSLRISLFRDYETITPFFLLIAGLVCVALDYNEFVSSLSVITENIILFGTGIISINAFYALIMNKECTNVIDSDDNFSFLVVVASSLMHAIYMVPLTDNIFYKSLIEKELLDLYAATFAVHLLAFFALVDKRLARNYARMRREERRRREEENRRAEAEAMDGSGNENSNRENAGNGSVIQGSEQQGQYSHD
ncbi:hypothetical protein COBT_002970 [Conglomerata obtusa]